MWETYESPHWDVYSKLPCPATIIGHQYERVRCELANNSKHNTIKGNCSVTFL